MILPAAMVIVMFYWCFPIFLIPPFINWNFFLKNSPYFPLIYIFIYFTIVSNIFIWGGVIIQNYCSLFCCSTCFQLWPLGTFRIQILCPFCMFLFCEDFLSFWHHKISQAYVFLHQVCVLCRELSSA